MKTAFVLICLIGFLYFCQETAQFASSLKHIQEAKIEIALNK